MSERPHSFVETLSNNQINTLRDLFEFRIERINWDFDQIFVDSEVPVKDRFFVDTGIDYRAKRIDQWLALSRWSEADGHMSFDEAKIIEGPIWENPQVIALAKPIREMQIYSQMAHEHNVIQSIVTTRIPELREVTYKSVAENFPWIDKHDVHIRSSTRTPRDPFKGAIVDSLSSQVHFEDSVSSTNEILRLSNAIVILFPRAKEVGFFKGNERVIEFPDMQLWMRLFGLHQDC